MMRLGVLCTTLPRGEVNKQAVKLRDSKQANFVLSGSNPDDSTHYKPTPLKFTPKTSKKIFKISKIIIYFVIQSTFK